MTQPCNKQLAYYAGYFDGEGCVSVVGRSLCARVANTYLPALEDMRAQFGGAIHSRGADLRRRPQHTLTLYGAHAEDLLNALLPHLREKQPQAYIALQWRRSKDGPEREAMRVALSNLKRVSHFPRKPQ